MQRLIAIFLLFAGSIVYCMAQSFLFMQMRSGDIMYYKLAERPMIQYSGTDMIVQTTTGVQNRIPVDEIRNIQYTPPTNISLLYNDLDGLTTVYSATGEYIATLNEPADINGLNLPTGVYVIRHNNAAEKMVVQ